MRSNILYMVVPCYNEEEVLPETADRLKKKLRELIDKNQISEKSRGAICSTIILRLGVTRDSSPYSITHSAPRKMMTA